MKRSVVFCLLWLVLPLSACGRSDSLRVVFYNVENFFDCSDDPAKNDNDFLPQGTYHWNEKRFYTKVDHLATALAAAGEDRFPDLFALSEVETEANLRLLLSTANQPNYRWVYYESPDSRGIDVCLAYHRYRFHLLDSRPIKVDFPGEPDRVTRDLLYVKGKAPDRKVYHIFVCHWPSKYGGAKSSEFLRHRAATVLRAQVDSLLQREPEARIVIMGDFNEDPGDEAMVRSLKALPDQAPLRPENLYNLMWPSVSANGLKSHKYQGEWYQLDQFVVSGTLLETSRPEVRTVTDSFLLEKDERYQGIKPFRTFYGRKYLGGYSDHLPIRMDIPLHPEKPGGPAK